MKPTSPAGQAGQSAAADRVIPVDLWPEPEPETTPRTGCGEFTATSMRVGTSFAFGAIPTWLGFTIARPNTIAGAEALGVAALQKLIGDLEPGSPEHIAAVMASVFMGVVASGLATGILHGTGNATLQLVFTALEECMQGLADCANPERSGRGHRANLEQTQKHLQGLLANVRKAMAQPQTEGEWNRKLADAEKLERHIGSINKDLVNIAIIRLPTNFGQYYDILETPIFPMVMAILTAQLFFSHSTNLIQGSKLSSTISALATTTGCLLMALETKRRTKAPTMFTGRMATSLAALHTGMLTQIRARFWASLSQAVSGVKAAGPVAASRGITLLRTHYPREFDTHAMRALQLGLNFLALWNLAMMWGPERRIPVTGTAPYAAMIADFHNKEVGIDVQRRLTPEQVQAIILAPASPDRDKAEEQLSSLAREFYDESRAAIESKVGRNTNCGSFPSCWKVMQELYHGAFAAVGVGLGAFGVAALDPPTHMGDDRLYWNPGAKNLMVVAMWTMGIGLMCMWAAKEFMARPQNGPGSATPRPAPEVSSAIRERGLEPSSSDHQTRQYIVFAGGLLTGAILEGSIVSEEGAMASFVAAMGLYAILQGFTRIADSSRDVVGYAGDAIKARDAMMNAAPKVYPKPDRFTPEPVAGAHVPVTPDDMHEAAVELTEAVNGNTDASTAMADRLEASRAQQLAMQKMMALLARAQIVAVGGPDAHRNADGQAMLAQLEHLVQGMAGGDEVPPARGQRATSAMQLKRPHRGHGTLPQIGGGSQVIHEVARQPVGRARAPVSLDGEQKFERFQNESDWQANEPERPDATTTFQSSELVRTRTQTPPIKTPVETPSGETPPAIKAVEVLLKPRSTPQTPRETGVPKPVEQPIPPGSKKVAPDPQTKKEKEEDEDSANV